MLGGSLRPTAFVQATHARVMGEALCEALEGVLFDGCDGPAERVCDPQRGNQWGRKPVTIQVPRHSVAQGADFQKHVRAVLQPKVVREGASASASVVVHLRSATSSQPWSGFELSAPFPSAGRASLSVGRRSVFSSFRTPAGTGRRGICRNLLL